jgi:hypothetical protein
VTGRRSIEGIVVTPQGLLRGRVVIDGAPSTPGASPACRCCCPASSTCTCTAAAAPT